jgi:Spy/CpxP family protein refolding chaperone
VKRAVFILIVGVLAAIAGYCAFYFQGTRAHRQMMDCPEPELAWLKKEFQLSDAELARITKLHEGYMPRCAELCRRIAEKNSELQSLIARTNVEPRAIEQKLKEAGDLRVECQKNMFHHFIEVSRQMPPEQRRRYLQWVQRRTLTPEHDMAARHDEDPKMAHH